ncbi:MAG: pyridoxal-phosphate dependent enzyme [Boseongicola sp.]|nr:MAG: pyridoxal-phosphate dependent enzyme [Boseongicola sp.]
MIDDIYMAAERLRGNAVETPLLNAPLLDAEAGRRMFVKAECLQKTGSFKYRGARNAVASLSDAERSQGVIAFSSGNHAQGVALAAREMGTTAVIIMPQDAPALKINNTKALGAEVVLYDRDTEDRDEIGDALAASRGLHLIRPFDDKRVIAGQGTTGLEIARQASRFGVERADVLVCCGGGGLTSGISVALSDTAPELRARPVEPEGFDDAVRSLEAGEILSNARPSGSICDAIVTSSPGKITFPIMASNCGPGVVVSDDDALRAMVVAFTRLKIVLEPGGAVALAAALYHRDDDNDVIAVASGGNVDATTFQMALTKFG